MLILWKTRYGKYRFFDDSSTRLSLIGYTDILSAYRAFPAVSTVIQRSLPLPTAARVIATSPDYVSFPALYPEFFI